MLDHPFYILQPRDGLGWGVEEGEVGVERAWEM